MPTKAQTAPDTPDRVEHPSLIAALAAAQGDLTAIPKTKTATVRGKDGKAGYSYKYADLADVLAAVRPVLARNGLALVQRTVREDRGLVLITEVLHPSGESMTSEVDLGAAGNAAGNPQAFGGTLTYLRRYEVVTLLGIQADEDTDANDHGDLMPAGAPGPAPVAPAPDDLVHRLRQGAGMAGLDADAIIAKLPAVEAGLNADAVWAAIVTLSVVVKAQRAAEEAKVAAAAQDAAAEAPDGPAPEWPAASPADVTDEAAAWARDADDDTLARVAQASGQADPARVAAARWEVERRVGEHDDESPADEPAGVAPSTVPMPDDLPTDPAILSGVLRGAGCICANPALAQEREDARDGACPIIGHGLPF